MIETTYKDNLLVNAHYICSRVGGKCRVTGDGNKRHVKLSDSYGRSCVVWFPVESRVHNLEVDDLKEAIEYITGHKAFSIV